MFAIAFATFGLFSFVLISADQIPAKQINRKLIIDNDAGGDDAVAIFLAVLLEGKSDGPKIVGLTTVNGNTMESKVYKNNQKILHVAKRQDIPIYRGSNSPLLKPTDRDYDYFGQDGLGDGNDTYIDLVPAKDKNAVSALIDISKTYTGELVVATLGPLTNIAMAIKLDPDFLSRLSHLYIGAGHVQYEHPEFNALTDVEAYRIVLENATPDKVTLVPFSQVQIYLNFSKDWRQDVFGSIDSVMVRALNIYERVSLGKEDRWQALDPAVLTIAAQESIVEDFKYAKNSIITCGDQRGVNINEFVDKKDANVRIAYKIKTEDYKNFLFSTFLNTK